MEVRGNNNLDGIVSLARLDEDEPSVYPFFDGLFLTRWSLYEARPLCVTDEQHAFIQRKLNYSIKI